MTAMTRDAWQAVEREINRPPRVKKWSRWGRGSCEGYNLEFGWMLRFSIVRHVQGLNGPEVWALSLNAKSLGCFPTFEEAVERANQEARYQILPLLDDWNAYQNAPPPKRRIRAGRRR